MRKIVILAGLALAFGAPVLAQTAPSDTLKNVIAKGTVINANVQGQALELAMAYKADGTYTASVMGQEAGGGTYTLDGDKLCTKSQLGEGCTVYPAGKKPGDEFKITSPTLGEATVKINQ